MKKLLLIATAMFVFAAVNAQEAKVMAVKAEMTDEKQKQEAELNEMLAKVGLSEEQIAGAKAAMKAASERSKAISANPGLTEEARAAQLKEVSDEKHNQLKEIMGEEKYKLYVELKKKQKEAAAASKD